VTVERAVRAELRRLGASTQTDGSAALAVALAQQVDVDRNAAVAAQLRLLLADLRAVAAKSPQKDGIDDLRARRASKAASG
jgi:hypothetical protein